jgi:hypothetical protein
MLVVTKRGGLCWRMVWLKRITMNTLALIEHHFKRYSVLLSRSRRCSSEL